LPAIVPSADSMFSQCPLAHAISLSKSFVQVHMLTDTELWTPSMWLCSLCATLHSSEQPLMSTKLCLHSWAYTGRNVDFVDTVPEWLWHASGICLIVWQRAACCDIVFHTAWVELVADCSPLVEAAWKSI